MSYKDILYKLNLLSSSIIKMIYNLSENIRKIKINSHVLFISNMKLIEVLYFSKLSILY